MYLSIAILFAQLGNVTERWEEQAPKLHSGGKKQGSNTMLIQPLFSGNSSMLGIATN